MVPDFFPLLAGRKMSYRTRATGGEGALVVETVRVVRRGPDRLEASCRSVARWPGQPESLREYLAVVEPSGVTNAGELEYPLPALPGAAWARPPRDFEIEGMTGEARTPAGDFSRCLVVRYTVAGGDAGAGRRFYAPGVGFVYETCSDETDPFELALSGVERA
jgi:hypothetical protein